MSTQLSSPTISGDGDFGSVRDGELGASLEREASGPSEATATGAATTPQRRSNQRLSRTNTAQNAKDRDGKALAKSSSGPNSPNAGLDPLSTQIYLRTNSNTEQTITQRLLHPNRPDSPNPEALTRPSTESQSKPSGHAVIDAGKDRRKGSSFLSRLSIRGPKKKDDDMQDSDSEVGELRMDGSSARALTSLAGAGGGFIPFHKEPPRYIRVKAHNKSTRDFNHLFLAQELLGCKTSPDEPKGHKPATVVGTKILKHGDAIWAAEFSLDGRYLAVAGKDQAVRVFSVISTAEERKEHETEEERHRQHDGQKLSAPVFRTKPTRVFEGHTGEVLALSWSKNGFLLSSSMDKTVKLWHLSRAECLCTFKHNDLVTSIAFHPTDDRFFLAGSLDAHLRLWSIPDKAVAFSAAANEFITAVSFSPDGKTSICGLMSGLCLFYTTEGLKLQSQLHVRSSRGKNAKGSKITGIKTYCDGESKDIKVLISSNDSRVRIYNLRTKMLEVKYRGHENQSSQIHARFNDNGTYVICGSEDRRAYVWSTRGDNDTKDKQPYECFDAHPEVVTTAIMAPLGTRQLLGASGDPIYDLCNPPPVTLMSLDEAQASQTKLSEGGQTESAVSHKKPEETPAYIERAKHLDGNIIVTTDRTGTIKVFRQDCAYAKRQQSLWETASKFSGRVASGLGRSGSIATRTSGGSKVHSRRGSLNLGAAQQTQPASDRIMSWRQDVEGRASSSATGRSERSVSPAKASRTPQNTSAANLASEARRQPYASNLAGRPGPASPTSSAHTGFASLNAKEQSRPKLPPAPSFSIVSASGDSDQTEDKDGSFWNLSRWKDSIPGLRGVQVPGGSGDDGTKKPAARRSLAIHDIQRLKVDDDKTSRRKSTGVVAQPPQPLDLDSNTASSSPTKESEPRKRVDAEAIRSARYSPKRRVDSGVAQLSDDASEGSNETMCRQCGGRSFSSRRGQGGKLVLRCLKCGEATA